MTEAQGRLLHEAERSIQAAELLAGNAFWGYAAARAYYAMFYVAEALLLGKGLSFSRHSAVIAAFGQHFAKTGSVPGEFHKHLMEAMALRQAGDYESSASVTPEQAKQSIRQAKALLSLARARVEFP